MPTEKRGRKQHPSAIPTPLLSCRSSACRGQQCMPGPAAQPEHIFASGNKLIESKEAARRPATATEDMDDTAVYHQVMAHLQKDTSKAAQAQQEVAVSHHHEAEASSSANRQVQCHHTCSGCAFLHHISNSSSSKSIACSAQHHVDS